MLVSVAMVRDKGDSVFEGIEKPFFVKEKCLEVTIRVERVFGNVKLVTSEGSNRKKTADFMAVHVTQIKMV